MKKTHLDVESDLPRFQLTRFYKELTRFPDQKLWSRILLFFDQTVRLLQKLRDSGSNVNAYDKETLDKVSWTWSNQWTSVYNGIFKIPGIESAKKKSKGMFSSIGPTKHAQHEKRNPSGRNGGVKLA